ncbi:Nucleolar protein 11, partial [Ophiophagus hannah]
AAFREWFTLCSLPGIPPQAPLGLELDEDRVLVTDRGRTVTLYKVSDQKPLGCWSVKQGQTISCPAVWNSETEEFILVHDDKVLQIWKEDDTDLDKVFKATLSSDVYRIHSLPHTEPLVLFKGGAVKNLDALLADPKQEVENVISDEVIRWSNALIGVEKSVLLFITEQDGNYFIYVQHCNPYTLQKFKFEQGVGTSTPLSFAAYLKNKVITLFCLYSNGCVYKILVPLQESKTAETQILPKSILLRLNVGGNILKGTSIVILDKDHIAVTGCLDSSESNVKDCFSIWNIKFQTLEASKDLPQGTTGQCWSYNDKLYIIHGRELEVILYKCETSSLAAAVGKSKDTYISEMKSMPVDWNRLQEDGMNYVEPDKPAKDESKRPLRSRKNVQEGTLTVEQLLNIIKGASQNTVEEKLLAFLSSTSTVFQASIGYIVSALVNRCKAESSFYPRRCLVQLIQTQGLSYSIGDDHLETMNMNSDFVPDHVHTVEHNKMDELSKIVQNGCTFELIEENSCDTQTIQKSQEIELSEICPVGPHKATLLNTIISSAYSETFLLPHLKDLSAKEVILFLQYLQYVYVQCSKESSTHFPGIFHLTIQQIMDWLCLLLDAHFTVVVMLPEARGLLSKLHKFVRAQVHFYSELNKIEGSLKHLQRINHPEDKGLYSIEVIKLT